MLYEEILCPRCIYISILAGNDQFEFNCITFSQDDKAKIYQVICLQQKLCYYLGTPTFKESLDIIIFFFLLDHQIQ